MICLLSPLLIEILVGSLVHFFLLIPKAFISKSGRFLKDPNDYCLDKAFYTV